jgi:hypothetical protein
MRNRRSASPGALAFLAASAVAALLLGGASPLPAQDLPPSFGRVDPDPDFLFRAPRISIGLRGGMFFHRADSDLFDFAEENLTVDRSDFRGGSLGIEGGVFFGPRLELTLSLDGSRVTLDSEYRDWVEEDGSAEGQPIRQTTRLREGPTVSAGARWYLLERGDSLGEFVWLPSAWNAFVGGGAGITGYDLLLSGDFLSEADGVISTERFASSGSDFFPFVSGGLEIGLSRRTALVVEGRYQWASENLSRDFQGFSEPIDLSGHRLTAGLFFRH